MLQQINQKEHQGRVFNPKTLIQQRNVYHRSIHQYQHRSILILNLNFLYLLRIWYWLRLSITWWIWYFQGPRWPHKSYGWKDSTSTREDISDIIHLANGADNLFTQQRNIPDNNPTVPDEFPKATTTGIGSHQSCKPAAQASINEVAYTSLDRLTPTSLDKAPLPSIDRRYECGRRAYDNFGARKFRWEQKDEYGVYREEYGLARSATGDMIPVTKDDIRKVLERASLFGEGSICLPEQATSHTPTTLTPITLAPEI